MPLAVVMARQNAAGEGVPGAAPDSLLSRPEVAVVFVQDARGAERHRALNCVLAHYVTEALAVTRRALLPFRRLVIALINGGGKRPFQIPDGVNQGTQIDAVALRLAERFEVFCRRALRHREVIEDCLYRLGRLAGLGSRPNSHRE